MMSFLSELQRQKSKLKETETVVTKADGRRFIERNDSTIHTMTASHGFVVDTKPDNVPVFIVDHLCIGSQDCTVHTVIEKYNIKHVLSLGIRVEVPVDSLFITCLDLPETSIGTVLKESLPYINKCVEAKENILVHCNAGVSRTSMVAIGYLMQYHKLPFEEAYNLVKSKRPAIQPNDGFKRQLKVLKPGELV